MRVDARDSRCRFVPTNRAHRGPEPGMTHQDMHPDGHQNHGHDADRLHHRELHLSHPHHARRVGWQRKAEAVVAGCGIGQIIQDDPGRNRGDQRPQHPCAASAQGLEGKLINHKGQEPPRHNADHDGQREGQSQMLNHG